ncbi:MAG: hypothetical protein IKZ05_00325 [Clostridia bacterium]|nr:hypothetical protein [Clostridia bacterium]
MASLNDVLKEVLEKDFDEKDVDKVVNLDGEATSDDRARTEAEAEQDHHGDSYVGPGDFVQNSVGRGAVESFIKNSVYEKYNIDASSMKSFARMTPTEILDAKKDEEILQPWYLEKIKKDYSKEENGEFFNYSDDDCSFPKSVAEEIIGYARERVW